MLQPDKYINALAFFARAGKGACWEKGLRANCITSTFFRTLQSRCYGMMLLTANILLLPRLPCALCFERRYNATRNYTAIKQSVLLKYPFSISNGLLRPILNASCQTNGRCSWLHNGQRRCQGARLRGRAS